MVRLTFIFRILLYATARVINDTVRYLAKVLIHSFKRPGVRKFASVDSATNFSGNYSLISALIFFLAVDDVPVPVVLQEAEVMFYNGDIEESTVHGASRLRFKSMVEVY